LIISLIKGFFPNLDTLLKQARIKSTPEQFIKKSLIIAALFTVILNLPIFFIFLKEGVVFLSLLTFFSFFFIISYFFFSTPKFAMRKKKNEIESDLLYSGRYFLLKLESGQPLINALIDVSATETKSAKYFGEIVRDIYLGMPLEDAIEYAIKYSPSKSYKKLLEQLKNALETGADIKGSLKSTMTEVVNQRVVEIQSYGKKLAPLAMFYMIIGTIVPSLGAAMIVVASSFINIKITLTVLMGLIGALVILQYFFLLLFKTIRPSVAI